MIRAQGLTKYYGESAAIQDLSFSIEAGEVVGILGLNGAGKTTTLRILSCLLLPSAGTVTIDGLEVTEQPHAIRNKVGFLPEEPPLYREMTVDAYLRFAGELRGLTRAEVGGRLEQVLAQTDTADVRHQVIGSLSHGYRKRVGIAQALIHQPPVVILDEPISGLDPVQIVEMRKLIRGLGGKHTVLVSSHILPEISQTCDHLLVIQKGRIVAAGSEAELTGGQAGAQRLKLTLRVDRGRVAGRQGEGADLPDASLSPGEFAAAFVGGLDGVERCQVSGGEGDLCELSLTLSEDRREALAEAVVGAGFGLLGMQSSLAELESVFLELTRDARPAEADAPPAAAKEVTA